MNARERRLKEKRGTYKAQQLLAKEEAEELVETSKREKRPELYHLFAYAAKALIYAKSISLMSRSKELDPSIDFVSCEVRLSEYVQNLRDYSNLDSILNKWPKKPGISIAWFTGRSALEVIIQFTQAILSAVLIGREEASSHGKTSYDQLMVSPECDARFAEWQKRTIKELNEATIPKHEVWPTMAEIHKECDQALIKLEDEYNNMADEEITSTHVIFYSWQSDLPSSINRSFIENALSKAVDLIKSDNTLEIEPVIDRDTAGIPGAPDIIHTIFYKIDKASIFACDVSIIQEDAKKPAPNPNVLIELGYAIKALGWDRIILIQNTFNAKVEQLPFDLRQRRVMSYNLAPDANPEYKTLQKNKLASDLKAAIQTICSGIPSRPTQETTLRDQCAALIKIKDLAGWRSLIEQVAEPIPDQLREWKIIGENSLKKYHQTPRDEAWKDDWLETLYEAVNICLPGFIPIWSSLEENHEDFWDESLTLLRQLLLLESKMGGGANIVLQIGEVMLYVAGSIGMAIAARTKQLTYIYKWTTLPMATHSNYGNKECSWLEISRANNPPEGVPFLRNDPFAFLTRLYESMDVKPFFRSIEQFKVNLFMANLIQSMIEFRLFINNDKNAQSLVNDKDAFKFHFDIYPIWVLMDIDDFNTSAMRLFTTGNAVMKFLSLPPRISENVWNYWSRWKSQCIKQMSDFRHGDLHMKQYLQLPGEPPPRH